MVLYKIYQSKREGTTNGKFYARAAVTETVGLDTLAEHMSNHNTPFSKGAIQGVLTDMCACIKELLLEGKQVKLPDLCIFKPGIETKPSTKAEDFTPAKNIVRLYVCARGTGELKSATMKADASFKEYGAYVRPEATTDEP